MFANCFRNPCNFISKRVNIYHYEGKYIVLVHVFHKTEMEMILAVNSAIIHNLPSLQCYRLRIKDGWERNTGCGECITIIKNTLNFQCDGCRVLCICMQMNGCK